MQISDEELKRISKLAERQIQLEALIKDHEDLIEGLTKELNDVRDKAIPTIMAEIGLSSFTLTNGKKIMVATEVYASIPKDASGPAFQWLRDNGHGAVIKNVISTEFGKGEDEKAIEAASILAEAGFTPTQRESVHAMTLKALLKEQIQQGVDVPLEAFGAFVVNRAKVK